MSMCILIYRQGCFKFSQYGLGSLISISGPDLIDTPELHLVCVIRQLIVLNLQTDPLFCSLLLHISSSAVEEVLGS